jgi:hypothetical protein
VQGDSAVGGFQAQEFDANFEIAVFGVVVEVSYVRIQEERFLVA